MHLDIKLLITYWYRTDQTGEINVHKDGDDDDVDDDNNDSSAIIENGISC